ncbi:MAG: phage shock protein B [bacterium]|nr:phage shock protein B [bacterium]
MLRTMALIPIVVLGTLFVLAVVVLAALVGLLRAAGRGREMSENERQTLDTISRNLDRMEERMANLETIVAGREEGKKES